LKSSSHAKRRIVRGVFFYTYDDNLSGKQIEMHELSLGKFNELILSRNFTKSPAAIKSTFDLVSFFDGRCEASISCERIKEECTSRTPDPTTTISTVKTQTFVNTTPINGTESWLSNRLHEKFSEIFISYLPRLQKQDYKLIRNELQIVDEYTLLWKPSQIKELLEPIFHFIRGGLQTTSRSAIPDKIRNIVSRAVNNIDPNMGLDEIKGIENAAIIAINKRDNVPSTESTTTSVLENEVAILTATSTSTTKPTTTTKAYIPPSASSRKPYTRWVGSYRKFSGYYSFGHSWRPFTGGNSWRTRRYSTEPTTTTARYQQDSLDNSLNPIGNSV